MPLLKNDFFEKIETWHAELSCQYTHFMSFSSKSEHDTVADQATLTNQTWHSCMLNKSVTKCKILLTFAIALVF